MKIIITKNVFQFLDDNNISCSDELEKIMENIKLFPKMFPMLQNDETVRCFMIYPVEFVYVIDQDKVIISECQFIKSSMKFRIRKAQTVVIK